MAKSTVNAALASLQHKFQAKIREVGALRRKLAELTANSTTPDEDANRALYEDERLQKQVLAKDAQVRIRGLNSDIDDLLDRLKTATSAGDLARFALAQSEAAYRRLSAHVQDVDGVVGTLKSDVSNWRSFSAVMFVIGVAVGGLGYMAYLAQGL